LIINSYRFALVATTTFNPSDKSANITLSGGNLTAENNTTTTFAIVRATTGKSSGKWYFEGTSDGIGAGGGAGIFGLVGSGVATSQYLSQSDGVGYFDTGSINRGGSTITSGLSNWKAATSNIQCAVDFDNGRVWFRKSGDNWNNSGSADPASNVGGVDISSLSATLYPGVSLYDNTTPDKITINFGGAAFTGSIPSGFSAWG
jgi:hypothetical protein